MSENFEAGLRELHARAASAHAGGAGFPTPALVSRARRNRRIRTAATSAVATVAVGGVAWAGSAVAGLGDPIEPAQPAVTTPSDKSPSADAGPACGSAIGDVPTYDEPPLVIEVTLDGDLIDPAAPLTGRVVLAMTDETYATLIPDGMLEDLDYWAVQDGVVVGHGGGSLVDGTWQTLSGRQGATALAAIQLQPCGTDASTLAAGDYQLVASMPLIGAGDGQDDEAVSRTVLGGPWPFTVLAESSDGQPESSAEQPEGPPALEDLVISFEGLGPLRFVDPLPTSPGPTDVVRWDEQACAGTEVPGRWVAAYLQPGEAWTNPPFTVWVFEDHAGRINVLAPGPHTTQGVQVSSSLAEVRAAYPDLVLLSTAADTGGFVDAWAIQDGERTVVFEVAANSDGQDYWSSGEVGRVVAIAALSGIPYDLSAWGGEYCG